MTIITRHVLFGTQNTKFSFQTSLKKILPLKNRKIRYPASRFFGVMVYNGSTGSICSVTQLEAYWKFTSDPTPVWKLKNHYMISTNGGSKCIGIGKFKFPSGDSAIKFDTPIVENFDSDSANWTSYSQEDWIRGIKLSAFEMDLNSRS